jgi:hypothetical protein
MFWKEPIIWIFLNEKKNDWVGLLPLDTAYKKTYVSARTIRVRLVFSIVNLVFPAWPAILPKREGLRLESGTCQLLSFFSWGPRTDRP